MDSFSALNVKEVAAYLRVTPQAVYNLIKREEIAAFKVGAAVRILRKDLDDYVARGKRLFAAQNADYDSPAPGVFAARRLCSSYGSFSLDSISFEIPGGSTLGVVGESGSGKTLLLKTLAGLVPLEGGAIYLGDKRLDQSDVRDRRIGLVFQDYALYPTMDGARNIGFPLEIANVKKNDAGLEVARIAADLGIEGDYLTKRIDVLPEGIKQLIAIGRAENKPEGRPVELFLMDEPLIHLDARLREETRVFLKRLVAAFGATTIYAFNEAADALALSDRLLVMRDGRAVQFGRTAEVYGRPADPETMELLSLNGANRLSGFFAEGRTDAGGYSTELEALLPTVSGGSGAYRGMVRICFRPEEVEAVPAEESGGPGILRASIDRAVPYGGERLLAVGRLIAGGKTEPSEGAPQVRFLIPEDAAGIAAFRPLSPMAYPMS